MTVLPFHIGPGGCADDADLTAAEYVLGTLPGPARAAAAERLAVDPEFGALVAAWQARFAPLNAAYLPVAPPDLLPEIEAEVFGTPSRVQGRNLWRLGVALGFGGVAAILLAALILTETGATGPPPARYAATLEARGRDLVFAADWSADTHDLHLVRTVGAAADAGHDYQLWLIGGDGAPVALGLLRGGETKVVLPAPHPGTELVISLEPKGGAPGPHPTGPILVWGRLDPL